MNVADWLRQLGLERYEVAFRENDISVAILPGLTAEDLKELGVGSVGHRRLLLQAIAALRSDASAACDPQALQSHNGGPSSNGSSSRSMAERRQLSVMFCDLMGSTTLSSRLDPEDLSAVIRGYQARVAETIAHFRGFIARYVGDGILIYFGWPEAHEDDAERAVRAALAVIDAIASAPVLTESLQVRIGIATGLVVVGERIGTGEARQQTAIGETPNLAARLQNLAGPDSILIDAATRRQIGGLFYCRDLGAIRLKGLPNPMPAWQVLAETAVESRFEALHAGMMTPLVGREEELDLLQRRWAHAKSGEGRVVLLSGEPGIGKSRLIAELEQSLSNEPHASLRYFCSPHHQESPLHPIIARWEQEAGFARGDTDEKRLRKLEVVLAPAGTSPEDFVLIASLLSVTTGDRYPKLESSPQRKKEKTLAALTRRLIDRARKQPVLMLFEDAHWADPSSLELLDRVINLVPELPALLVVSFRPEFAAPWIGHAGVTLLTLSRLDRRQASGLAAQFSIGHRLTPALLDRVVAQTDGVPLFIEELTKAVLETAAQPEGAKLSVPDTLQATLLARLDRQPEAKQVAQIGAVIGRTFSHALLATVARLPEAQLAQGLNELVASGFAFRRGVPPEAIYSFKHSLVQEAAYDSLLRSRRAEIHATVVAVAEADASVATLEPGVLGQHCAQAGLIVQAADYFRIAGARLAEQSAFVETRTQLERGLALTESLPSGADRDRMEAELLLALGRFLMVTKGNAETEAVTLLDRAVAVCRRANLPETLAPALYSLASSAVQRGDISATRAFSEELLALGHAQCDAEILSAAHTRLGVAAQFEGCLNVAHDHLTEALVAPVPGGHRIFGHAVQRAPVVATGFLALTLACLGYPDRAVVEDDIAIERARTLGTSSLANVFAVSSRTHFVLRDEAKCLEYAEAQVAIAEEHGIPYFAATGRCLLSWLAAKKGNVAEGLPMLLESLALLHDLGNRPHETWAHGLLSDVLAWAARPSDAITTLNEALALSTSTGLGWFDTELRRRKGELLLANPTAAEQWLREAIDIARNQSAKLFEIRSSASLARLWMGQGKRVAARELLTPVYAWFTEGFHTPDLKDARALLDALA